MNYYSMEILAIEKHCSMLAEAERSRQARRLPRPVRGGILARSLRPWFLLRAAVRIGQKPSRAYPACVATTPLC